VTRLVIAGVTWLAAFSVFAAIVWWSARPPRPSPTPPAVTALVRALNRLEPSSQKAADDPWTVTRATSAHHSIVIDVEADHPVDAGMIAEQIVAPLRSTYNEVLIYVRPTGNPVNAVVRRIQWTPHGGFVESSY